MQVMLRWTFRSYFPRSRASIALKLTRRCFSSNKGSLPQLAFVSSAYEDMYKRSIEDPAGFWGELAANRLQWIKPFTQVKDCDLSVGRHRWFFDGKLNVSGSLFFSKLKLLTFKVTKDSTVIVCSLLNYSNGGSYLHLQHITLHKASLYSIIFRIFSPVFLVQKS